MQYPSLPSKDDIHGLARSMQAPCLNYLSRAVEAVVEIHKSDMPGDILLFVTGQDDVETAVQLLRDEAQRLSGSRLRTKLLPLPLYAGVRSFPRHLFRHHTHNNDYISKTKTSAQKLTYLATPWQSTCIVLYACSDGEASSTGRPTTACGLH